jgi:peptidoglycan/LPS O-acetylase OafA/YrhL
MAKKRESISIKAVLLGILTDVGGSLAVSFMLGIILAVYMVFKHIPSDEAENLLYGMGVMIPGSIIGFGFTCLGGYIAGRIAKQAQVLHGALVGLASLVVGILALVLSSHSYPTWLTIFSFVSPVPGAMAGGYLAMGKGGKKRAKRKKRK